MISFISRKHICHNNQSKGRLYIVNVALLRQHLHIQNENYVMHRVLEQALLTT